MNKLTLVAGGLPFEIEDFQFEQTAVRDAFAAVAKAIGYDGVVVLLTPITYLPFGSSMLISDADLIIDNEFCKHSSTAYSTAGGIIGFYWEIEETIDHDGDDVLDLNPAVTATPWRVRKAKCVPYTGALPVGKVRVGYEQNLGQRLLYRMVAFSEFKSTVWGELNNAHGVWQNISFAGSYANKAGYVSKYRKTADNYLECWMWFRKGTNNPGSASVFTLNTGFWPNVQHNATIVCTGTVISFILINDDGTVTLDYTTIQTSAEYQVYFKIPINI